MKASEVARLIKPFVVGWINDAIDVSPQFPGGSAATGGGVVGNNGLAGNFGALIRKNSPGVRAGSLNLLGLNGQEGIVAGKKLTDTTCPYIALTDTQIITVGMKQTWWDTARNTVGEINPEATGASPLVWLGPSASDKKLEFLPNGTLKLRGSAIMGNGVGFVVDTAKLYCPYDGPEPAGHDFQINTTGHLGQEGRTACNVLGRPGKYGKAFESGATASNFLKNPSFEVNVTDDWTFFTTGTGGGLLQATGRYYVGNNSLRIQAASAGTAGARSNTNISLSANQIVTAQARVLVLDSSASAKVVVYDVDNAQQRGGISVSGCVGQWELITASWMNDTGASTNVRCQLQNTTSDNATRIWFDAAQLEYGHATPFLRGGMSDGHTWDGTAHNSQSVRVQPRLAYSGSILGQINTFSVSTWINLPSASMDSNGWICERYTDTDNRWALTVSTNGKPNLTYRVGGTSDTINSSSALIADRWHHIAAVFSNTQVGTTGSAYLYVDGVLAGSTTLSASYNFSSASLFIGAKGGWGNNLNGYIDDFVVVDRQLTANEIQAIYEANGPLIVTSNKFEFLLTGEGKGKTFGHSGGVFGQTTDGTKSFALSNEDTTTTWGGFTLGEGDMVLGDNKTNSAAIFWDKSAGTFGFYGNGAATPQVSIGTDGTLNAGGSLVSLNSNGVSLTDQGTSSSVSRINMKYVSGAASLLQGYIVGDYGGGDNVMWMVAKRTSSASWAGTKVILAAIDDVTGSDIRFSMRSDGAAQLSSTTSFTIAGSVITSGCLIIDSSRLFINESLNGGMTRGITINQGTADDEIFAAKSTDISHNHTILAESDTYGTVSKVSAASGGMSIHGFRSGTIGLRLRGYGSTDVTTKATNSNAYVAVDALTSLGSGSSGSTATANANLVVFRNDNVTRMILDAEGDLHLDASSNASAYDAYDDIALLNGLRASTLPKDHELRQRFGEWMAYARPVLESAGIVTYNDDTDGRPFINMKGAMMLTIDAIRQIASRMEKLENAVIMSGSAHLLTQ